MRRSRTRHSILLLLCCWCVWCEIHALWGHKGLLWSSGFTSRPVPGTEPLRINVCAKVGAGGSTVGQSLWNRLLLVCWHSSVCIVYRCVHMEFYDSMYIHVCIYTHASTCMCVIGVFALLCVLNLSARLEFSPFGAQFPALQTMKPICVKASAE